MRSERLICLSMCVLCAGTGGTGWIECGMGPKCDVSARGGSFVVAFLPPGSVRSVRQDKKPVGQFCDKFVALSNYKLDI